VSAPRSPSLWGAFIMSVTLLLAFGARHALAVMRVQIGEAEGVPGNDVVIGVVLTVDAGESVAAVENDIVFDPIYTPVAIEANGRPDCTVNTAINKEATRFGFRPPGCDPTGGGCSAVHAVVIAIDNVTPITSGALLYTCRLHISEDAPPGPYPLSNFNVLYAPPPGGNIEGVGLDGQITVLSPEGDADCDGKLTEADVETTVETIFDDATACDPDCNRDGRVSAADFACVAAQFGSSH
jgi:hypothetical protein